MSEQRLNANDLAAALGVSRKTITRYVRAGCPSTRIGTHRTAPHAFLLEEVKAWMRDTARTGEGGRPAEGTEPRRSKRDARPAKPKAPRDKAVDELEEEGPDTVELVRRVNLRIKELEVTKRERLEREAAGETLPRAAVFRAWDGQIEIVRARFRSLPDRLAQECQGKTYDDMHDIIKRELDATLVAFSREELPV